MQISFCLTHYTLSDVTKSRALPSPLENRFHPLILSAQYGKTHPLCRGGLMRLFIDDQKFAVEPDDLQIRFERTLDILVLYHDSQTPNYAELSLKTVKRIADFWQRWGYQYLQRPEIDGKKIVRFDPTRKSKVAGQSKPSEEANLVRTKADAIQEN
jgi:hypothetical protein